MIQTLIYPIFLFKLTYMKRLMAKRDGHPTRGATENGAKRETLASGQPCNLQQMHTSATPSLPEQIEVVLETPQDTLESTEMETSS